MVADLQESANLTQNGSWFGEEVFAPQEQELFLRKQPAEFTDLRGIVPPADVGALAVLFGSVPSRGVIRARRFGCGDGFSCPRRAD